MTRNSIQQARVEPAAAERTPAGDLDRWTEYTGSPNAEPDASS